MSFQSDLYMGIRNFRNYRKGKPGYRGMVGAVLGIALSMLPVLVVLEVSSGMIEGITRRYVEVSSFHLQAGVYQDYRETRLPSLVERLKELPEVVQVTPFIKGQGLLYAPGGRMGVQVRGMEPGSYASDPGLRQYLQFSEGTFTFGQEEKGILISRAMADTLGAGEGDQVKLLVSRTSRSGRTILRPGNYTVTGIFSTGYHELDMFTIFMSYSRAEQVFGDTGTQALGIKVKDYTRISGDLQDRIQSILPETWFALSWYDLDRSLYQNLQSTRTMLVFIMAIIILVAGVNISSSLLNLVMEKQEQIAVLKSMGVGPGAIRRQFLMTGFIIGLLGIIGGNLLGLLFSVNINQVISLLERVLNLLVLFGRELLHPLEKAAPGGITLLNPEYYLEEIPIRIPLLQTILVGGFTMLVSLLAAYLPASKASRIRPLEIIRHH